MGVFFGMKKLDYSKIEDVYVAGINYRDAPDFCDAYIESAWYDGREMTDEELDEGADKYMNMKMVK